MNPPDDVVAEYVARKQAKGTWGVRKSSRWKLPCEDRRRRTVDTGICPCPACGHQGEAMIVCDAGYNDCFCCSEVCS